MTTDEARARIERLIEVAIFAPVGIALTLRDMAPTFINMFVSRGRAEIDRQQHAAERRVKTLRSTGEVALAFGVPMVRDKVAARVDAWRGITAPDTSAPPTDSGAVDATPPTSVARATPSPAPVAAANGSGPPADDLAIPGYDQLAASQVVERLIGLSGDELGAVRRYEAAHRNRRTILGKIDQLASA